MHRSGTSTVAGVLHLNKIIMGTYQNFWPRPLTQNPKGFYENYDFRKINDELLNKEGYDVKTYEPQIPYSEMTDRLYTKMHTYAHINTQGAAMNLFMPARAGKPLAQSALLYKRMAYAATVNTTRNLNIALKNKNLAAIESDYSRNKPEIKLVINRKN